MNTWKGLLICMLCIFKSGATVKHVPGSFLTIQSALNACAANDTVLVQPGTYNESILWPLVSGVKLFSAGDSSNTVLTTNGNGGVIRKEYMYYDTTSIIRGFKITGGAPGTVSGNGTGIYIDNSGIKLEQVAIVKNKSATYGGGVYCRDCNLHIENSQICGNVLGEDAWGFGGGIFLRTANAKLKNVKIQRNFVYTSSWVSGCGLYSDLSSTIIMNNVDVSYNRSDTGASWKDGAGISIENSTIIGADINISHNLMASGGNWYHGGGVYLYESKAFFTNISVTSNSLSSGGMYYYGGGIYAGKTDLSITNGLIAANVSDPDTVSIQGAGISMDHQKSRLLLLNSTIAGNKAIGTPLISGSGIWSQCDTLFIRNSILYNPNQGSEITSSHMNTSGISYSNIRGGATGTTNINADPVFVSSSNFRLSSTSPCINTANQTAAPLFDLENNPRPFGGGYDMGCYEYNPTVGINDIQQRKGEINLFPNPVENSFTIRIISDLEEEIQVVIRDVMGKEIQVLRSVLHPGINEIVMKAEDLSKGIYFIVVSDNQKILKTTKIIRE